MPPTQASYRRTHARQDRTVKAVSSSKKRETTALLQNGNTACGTAGLAHRVWRTGTGRWCGNASVQDRLGRVLSRSSCLNYLHRLGFVVKRPKKRLLEADAEQRDAFVAAYAALCAEAKRISGKIFFVDEAHFRADVELRVKWVLRGDPRW